MSLNVTAFNHVEWDRFGLANYEDFADQISECNVGQDTFSGSGEWFFIPDERLPNNDAVIYFGTWSDDHSPGASSYTYAEIFDMDDPDDAAEFLKRVQEWKGESECRFGRTPVENS
ncbi:MAG: hypothetical protein GXX96_35635 [Planctomycetaceae bacterium]|nr:hypothetical protein [Planctomycetaceae bacterium]